MMQADEWTPRSSAFPVNRRTSINSSRCFNVLEHDIGPVLKLPDLHLPILVVYILPVDEFLLILYMFAAIISSISDVLMYQDGYIVEHLPIEYNISTPESASAVSDVELNPLNNDADLRPVGAAKFKNIAENVKPCRFMMRRGITMDSGAGDNVFPKRMVNSAKIRTSPGQRLGLHYVAASSHRIPNLGEVDLNFMTLEGHDESWICQIADVNKPLGAVSDRVDKGHRVVYDKDMDTGQDLSYILNKSSGRVAKMRREGNVWVLDAVVNRDMIEINGFSRQS